MFPNDQRRKTLIAFLEAQVAANTEGAELLLKAVTNGLTEVDLKLTEADKVAGLEKSLADALAKPPEPAKPADPAKPAATPELTAALEQLAALEKREEIRDAKFAEQKIENDKATIHTALMADAKKSFGDLTGELLVDRYIGSKELTVNDSGKVQLTQNGVAYLGTEVVDRLRTAHKDSIVGEPGPGTARPGSTTKQQPTTGEKGQFDGMSAHALIAQAFDAEQA